MSNGFGHVRTDVQKDSLCLVEVSSAFKAQPRRASSIAQPPVIT